MEDGSPVEGWWREPMQLEIVNMNTSNWEELEKENGEESDDGDDDVRGCRCHLYVCYNLCRVVILTSLSSHRYYN